MSTERKQISQRLHDIGEIMRYEDFLKSELSASKTIVDPRLVTDLASEVFAYSGPGESLPHAELCTFALWKALTQTARREMKLLLRSLRLVHQIGNTMDEWCDLLIVANWTQVEHGYNLHVGPLHLKYERGEEQTHPHHVVWEFHVGHVLDEAFFERLAVITYSTVHTRCLCSGIIKYAHGTRTAPRDHGQTEMPFCQVWVDQIPNDDGEYVVFVEAVAASPADQAIWVPFALACIGIVKAYGQHIRLVYARHEDGKNQVKDVIQHLREQPGVDGRQHDLPWMPPNLSWAESLFTGPPPAVQKDPR